MGHHGNKDIGHFNVSLQLYKSFFVLNSLANLLAVEDE